MGLRDLLGSAVLLAAWVAISQWSWTRVAGRGRALLVMLPALLHGIWAYLPIWTTREGGFAFAGASIAAGTALFVLTTSILGRDGARPGARAGLSLYGAVAVVPWLALEFFDGTLGEVPWIWPLAVVILAAALGRAAPLLALVALIPGSSTPWTASGPAPDKPDILLITVDTLRADRAPQMRAFTDGDAFVAQAPSPWTLPSLATLHTGLQPDRHGAGRRVDPESGTEGFAAIVDDVQTLAERLSEAGYDTAATVEQELGTPTFGLTRGFDRFELELIDRSVIPGSATSNVPILPGRALLAAVGLIEPVPRGLERRMAEARDVLASRRERPLFLWIHFLDPHLPYTHAWTAPDMALRERVDMVYARFGTYDPLPDPEVLELIERAYDHEVQLIDAALLELLAEAPPAAGRIAILTSDHGEEFGEHGGWEHGHTMFQELLAVPLTFHGLEGIDEAATPVGLVDVTPTLLATLGLPADDLDGRNLRADGQAPPYPATNTLYGDPTLRAVYSDGRKLISGSEGCASYDLTRDPSEQHPLAPDMGLVEYLPRWDSTVGSPLRGDEVDAALEALGYLDRGEAPSIEGLSAPCAP